MKILVIENDAEAAAYVTDAFDAGWSGVELLLAHRGRDGIELAEKHFPDTIILDLDLPDMSGFEVLRRIRLFFGAPIIVTSTEVKEAEIVKGLTWGADEYIVKPFGQLEMVARVKALLRRRYFQADGPFVCGPLRLDPDSDQAFFYSRRIYLTPTETRMLRLLMSKAGHTASYAELADAIWGGEYPNAPGTLRVYIRRLRTKINTFPEHHDLIRSKPGIGYFLQVADFDRRLDGLDRPGLQVAASGVF